MKDKSKQRRRDRPFPSEHRARLIREPEIIRIHRPPATGAIVGDAEAFEPRELDMRPKA